MIWARYQAGVTPAKIGREVGRDREAVRRQIRAAGGIRPTIPHRAARHLTVEEREEISRGLAAGHSLRQIAHGHVALDQFELPVDPQFV